MNYQSTRDKTVTITPSQAVIKGIADDGGLFMFSNAEDIKIDCKDLMGKSFYYMAQKILSKLLDDYSEDEMKTLVKNAYLGKFETEDITPTVKVGDNYVLELFRGPTSAFKDVALSMLPQLMTAARKKHNVTDKILILTATSGDTGKAALEGFHDVDGVGIIVFYPEDGVSAVQKAQMVTQVGKNVCVCAVKGNFDDAQTGVKKIFASAEVAEFAADNGVRLSSANSINIGRLAPQVVYYFKSYSDLIAAGDIAYGDEVNFCVPTGNFGDILAGYLAKLMGLPVGKLICASNKNDVLTDFFKTGEYNRKRTFYKTASPSMDILISSNLERLLYLASNCDSDYVAELMNSLNKDGSYRVTEEIYEALNAEFAADCCDDDATKETIKDVWKKYGYMCDTHTAVAWNVAEKYIEETGDSRKMVVLSTASPFKFPASVMSAVDGDLSGTEFDVMNRLSAISKLNIPKGLSGLENAEAIHKSVIEKEKMADFVMDNISF